MEIINNTKFYVETSPFKCQDGSFVLSIIVKGSFEFNSREVRVAKEQLPICFGDELFDEEDGGSVKFESDMVPFKPKTDIVLVGKAYAAGGKPVVFCDVTLRVGEMQKTIRVFGDRKWDYGGKLMPEYSTAPMPFSTMDMVYENAFGGMDLKNGAYCRENLLGKGFVAKKNAGIADIFLPNLEDPNHFIKSCADHPKPVGFGFYGKAWEPRISYTGTYDEIWRKERSPDLPEDFNPAFYNGAHPDLQREGYLNGDEAVELVNLTSDGCARFQLPGVDLRCYVEKTFDHSGDTNPPEEINVPLNLDTLCMISDKRMFYQVWRGACPIEAMDSLEVKSVLVEASDFIF